MFIARDDVVSDDLTEGVIIEDGRSVDVGKVRQVPHDVGQDVSRGPDLHQVALLGLAQTRPAPAKSVSVF